MAEGHQIVDRVISIHALREEGDVLSFIQGPDTEISIHALREEGDNRGAVHDVDFQKFLSTPSARRATAGIYPAQYGNSNFYPRPPRGGRPAPWPPGSPHGRFLSTPSARRATEYLQQYHTAVGFLSTPSARRATKPAKQEPRQRQISIHALREEGDSTMPRSRRPSTISIHALREEGDPRPCSPRCCHTRISIHALREEGDPQVFQSITMDNDFYPRPPRGGRRRAHHQRGGNHIFLSTPSARRATRWPTSRSRPSMNFYPRPPRGGRPTELDLTTDDGLFLSTPSARRATLPEPWQ